MKIAILGTKVKKKTTKRDKSKKKVVAKKTDVLFTGVSQVTMHIYGVRGFSYRLQKGKRVSVRVNQSLYQKEQFPAFLTPQGNNNGCYIGVEDFPYQLQMIKAHCRKPEAPIPVAKAHNRFVHLKDEIR